MSIEACGESDSDYGFYTTCEYNEIQHRDLSILFDQQMQYLLVSNTERAGASAKVGIEYEWGKDKDKNNFKGFVEAECHDRRGNQIESRVEKNGDGSGKASLSGKAKTSERPH